ncbi:MAG: hypothetical protein JNL29_09285 [Nitrospira sp.]|nr:hypothetical protein [Nitrospira sp.]
MKDIRQGAHTDKTHQPNKAGESVLDSKDLTCQEAQLEELLSEGESTEGDAEADGE